MPYDDMTDFKQIFSIIKARIAVLADIQLHLRQNAKLRPGASMEARLAERDARLKPIRAAANIVPVFVSYCGHPIPDTISWLLTAHRTLRGKPAGHGVAQEKAVEVTDWVIARLRKEIAVATEGAKAAGLA